MYYTSGYSTTSLSLRAKSSLYHSLNGGGDSYSQSSLYSLNKNSRLLLYSYLLSRRQSSYIHVEPSRTFLLTSRRVGTLMVPDAGSCKGTRRCCCCSCCCSDEEPLRKDKSCSSDLGFSSGFELDSKKPLRKEHSCSSNEHFPTVSGVESKKSFRKEEYFGRESANLPKKSSYLNDLECNNTGRRRKNVLIGESSRNMRELDRVDSEEKEVREVQKHENSVRLDKRVRGHEEVGESSRSADRHKSDYIDTNRLYVTSNDLLDTRRASGSSSSLEIRDAERRSSQNRRYLDVDETKYGGNKISESRNVDRKERISSERNDSRLSSQKRLEEVRVNAREEKRTELGRHKSDYMDLNRRTSGTSSSLEIKTDERRSGKNQKYFNDEEMKHRENFISESSQKQYGQVSVNTRLENRTEVDRLKYDYTESNRQDETRSELSDSRRTGGKRSSIEIRDNYGRLVNERYLVEDENLVQVARENRSEIDHWQEFDKMETNRRKESHTDVLMNLTSDTVRANDTSSSLEIRSTSDNRSSIEIRDSDRRLGNNQRHFGKDNIYVSTDNSVQVAAGNRSQIDRQEFDKMESYRQDESHADVSRIHTSHATRVNDTSSSLETRAGSRWSGMSQKYFREEQMNERENRSTSVENVIRLAREKRSELQRQELDKQYENRASSSRMHASETERASSSNGSLQMRTDSAEDDFSKLHRTEEIQRTDLEEDAMQLELETSYPTRTSNLQGISDTRIEKQNETLSQGVFMGESRVGQSSYGRSTSMYQVRSDAIESASRLGKSSSFYVGDFVNRAQQEMSTTQLSETGTGTHARTSGSVQDVTARFEEEKYAKGGVRQSQSRTRIKGPSDEMWELGGVSSQEPSTILETAIDSSPLQVVDITTTPQSAESAISKKNHKSLWTYLAGIIKLGWGQSSRSHNSATKSNGRTSSIDSVGSEAFFSGNEDDDEDETKKGTNVSPVPTKMSPEEDQVASSTPSGTLRIRPSLKRASVITRAQGSELYEAEESGEGNISDVVQTNQMPEPMDRVSGKSVEEFGRIEGSEMELRRRIRSPTAIESSRNPIVRPHLGYSTSMGTIGTTSSSKGGSLMSKPGNLNAESIEQLPSSLVGSGSGQMSESGLAKLEHKSDTEKLPEVSGSEEKDSELKRRKLQRNKQVMREQFDDWEEAYIHESEQRKTDEFFMREALLEAKRAADSWEVPVGAVLVHDGKIIARGCNLVEELRDSTAHAEMICIREASNILRTWRLAETTLYVTLEPCAMCAGAILQARVETVVWGAPNKLLGADGSWVRLFPSADGGSNSTLDSSNQTAGPIHPFHPKITIRRGVLATECADTMQQFFQLRRKKIKKEEIPPPSCLPVSTNPTKIFTKMHDLFSIMFCL